MTYFLSVSKSNSSDVKLLTKSGEIKPFLSVSPLLPMGIHVTSDNYIIAGVIEHGATYTPSCNNVAPVTNVCLGRATTRSHSSQWSKKKVAVET